MNDVNRNKKDLKNRKRYTASFDIKLFNALKKYSDDTSIPFSKLLDKSIYGFLESNDLLNYLKEDKK